MASARYQASPRHRSMSTKSSTLVRRQSVPGIVPVNRTAAVRIIFVSWMFAIVLFVITDKESDDLALTLDIMTDP